MHKNGAKGEVVATKTITVTGDTTANTGTLTVSTDSSSPAYQIVASGTTGVTLSVSKVRAAGESVNINKLDLLVANSDVTNRYVTQLYAYSTSGQLLGRSVLVGDGAYQTMTLTSPLLVQRDTDARIILKIDIAAIGTGQPARAGDLVQIGILRTIGTGVTSGLTVTGVDPNPIPNIPGVRIFRSYPIVALEPMLNDGLGDGRVIRFRVDAHTSGPIGIAKLTVYTQATNASLNTIVLNPFIDSAYSIFAPLPGAPTGIGAVSYNEPTGLVRHEFNLPAPLEIPAGESRYFSVQANMTLTGASASVTATLYGDSSFHPPVSFSQGSAFSSNNFIWSPNTQTTSQFSDGDWTNGFSLSGLGKGISQTRTGGAVTPTEARGTYIGYFLTKAGKVATPFIMTQDITQADALANCKLNAANNPSQVVRCTWNDVEIYNSATGVGASATTPNANLANALTALESALKALIGKLGQ